MQQEQLIPHLFRTEHGKITAVLCRYLGVAYMELAEDIASETFLAAMETWPYKGIPENPTAWLYTVAKNRAVNHLRRNRLFEGKIAGELKQQADSIELPDIDLSEANIADSQLRMLFAICHPAISEEAQIGLALRVLCGFGIDEIATAFLTGKETINKRLYRAREKLRLEQVSFDLPPRQAIMERMHTVLTTLYLLFNEGYYSEVRDEVVREDLCLEAIRLCYLLVGNEYTDTPEANALLALMCFHASRLAARKDSDGQLILYDDQDETLWNAELIRKGSGYLNRASQGDQLSRYHLEAGIAYWHTVKEDSTEKWDNILQLYNILLQLAYSPVAALNRTFALSKVKGKEHAIAEAEKLGLSGNHYYFVLLGALYTDIDNSRALEHYREAYRLAKTQADQQTVSRKIRELEQRSL